MSYNCVRSYRLSYRKEGVRAMVNDKDLLETEDAKKVFSYFLLGLKLLGIASIFIGCLSTDVIMSIVLVVIGFMLITLSNRLQDIYKKAKEDDKVKHLITFDKSDDDIKKLNHCNGCGTKTKYLFHHVYTGNYGFYCSDCANKIDLKIDKEAG